jgi:ribosome-associated heat shock protein Hsp15
VSEGGGASLRLDVALHRLCLTRSRSEAKTACEADAIMLDGRPARPSDAVTPGRHIVIRYPRRTVEVEVLTLPAKGTSRAQARELYRVVRDEQPDEGAF